MSTDTLCALQVARVDLCRYRKSADWVMALHAPNAAGDTPLHTSMALPDIPEVTEIIQAFVAVGADISRPNSEGKSALDLAEVSPLPPCVVGAWILESSPHIFQFWQV